MTELAYIVFITIAYQSVYASVDQLGVEEQPDTRHRLLRLVGPVEIDRHQGHRACRVRTCDDAPRAKSRRCQSGLPSLRGGKTEHIGERHFASQLELLHELL